MKLQDRIRLAQPLSLLAGVFVDDARCGCQGLECVSEAKRLPACHLDCESPRMTRRIV